MQLYSPVPIELNHPKIKAAIIATHIAVVGSCKTRYNITAIRGLLDALCIIVMYAAKTLLPLKFDVIISQLIQLRLV